MTAHPRPRTGLAALAIAQIVAWGVLYYAVLVAAPAIAADTGWDERSIFLAITAGLLTSAACAIPVGRWLDGILAVCWSAARSSARSPCWAPRPHPASGHSPTDTRVAWRDGSTGHRGRVLRARPEGDLDLPGDRPARILALPGVELRVTKSQVAFRARRGFAYAWAPGRYVSSHVPLVLTIALPEPLHSDRFKEVAHPSASVWMHHLELRLVKDVDHEVIGWLRRAYEHAR